MDYSVFDKNLPRSCLYCVFGKVSELTNEVLCQKHGITELRDSCRHYKYNPLNRVPEKHKIANNYKPEDFSL